MDEQLIKQIQAVITFKQAYTDLINAWELEHTSLNDLESIKHYPFEQSFDEYDVITWLDETFKELSLKVD